MVLSKVHSACHFVIPLLKDGEPLSRQIYLWFRQAILRDEMKSNERLPSTRELAEHLDVSRTVVVLAYEQLLAEGFVRGRPGSGTYVAVPGIWFGPTRGPAAQMCACLASAGRWLEAAPKIEVPAKRAYLAAI